MLIVTTSYKLDFTSSLPRNCYLPQGNRIERSGFALASEAGYTTCHFTTEVLEPQSS